MCFHRKKGIDTVRNNTGFTLAELMITIAIIGIISAIAIPNMIGWVPKYRLQNAASDLRGELQATRFRAIKENREFAIFFDTANNRYQVVDSGPNRNYDGLVGGTDDLAIKTVNLSQYYSGVGYGNGNATIDATVAGNPFPGGFDFVSYASNAVVFLPTGLIQGMGYVYLTNIRGDAFALGTPSIAGTVVLRIWDGGNWTQ